jgi:hypothetical protein
VRGLRKLSLKLSVAKWVAGNNDLAMKLRPIPILGLILAAICHLAHADDSSVAAVANPVAASNPASSSVFTNNVPMTNAAPAIAPMSVAPAATAVAVIPQAPVEPAVKVIPAQPPHRPLMIGGELGTLGGGVVGRWQFADHLGVGVAYDYLSATYNGKIQGNEYRTHLRLATIPITLDGYPLNNNYLRLSGGIVINRNHFTGSSTGSVDLNGTTYSGTALLDIKQQPVNPYFAVGGNFYFTRDHRFSMGGELGFLYSGEPRVHLRLNPPNAGVEAQRRQEESDIRHYARYAEIWPVVKLSINYSF